MSVDPIWLALLGLLAAALAVYGLIDRRGGAGGYWPWGMALLAFTGFLMPAGYPHASRFVSTFIPVLLLLGAMHWRAMPIPGWILPATLGLAVLRGLLSAVGANDAGAVLALVMDAPIVLIAARLMLRPAPASWTPGRLFRAIGVGLVVFAAVEGLEALDGLGFPVVHSRILSWIWVGVPLGTMQVAASFVTLRRRADRSEHESHRSAHRLAESEERLRTILSSLAGTHVVVYDRDGNIRSMFGVPRSEVTGDSRRIEDYLDPETAASVHRMIREVFDTGELRQGRQRVALRAGVFWYDASLSPLRNATGEITGVLSVARDVTAQVDAEEERRDLEARMQHGQKLESLGVLAGGIAHDFNNLLVGILGNAELLAEEIEPGSKTRHLVDDIQHASERASELTHQLLAYAGKAEAAPRTLELEALVREMTQLVQSGLPRTVDLRVEVGEENAWIHADPTQVRQVVMNLITNAADALEGQPGSVTVRAGVKRLGQRDLERCYIAEGADAGEYAYVEVADTGRGVDAETVEKIFDPFFTTKARGRGLGLAAVLGIVRSHGGAIRVESEPSLGTIFSVFLPRARERSRREAAPPAAGEWRGHGTLLVVDDENLVRKVAVRSVERLGFRVLSASSGEEALNLYRAHEHEISGVLLDVTMPSMDGEEVFEELRRTRPDLPVLFMSGHSSRDIDARLASKTRVDRLRKPFRREELASRLCALLGEGEA